MNHGDVVSIASKNRFHAQRHEVKWQQTATENRALFGESIHLAGYVNVNAAIETKVEEIIY